MGFSDKSASALYIFNDNVVSNSVLFNTESKLTRRKILFDSLLSAFPPHFWVSACATGGGFVYNTV